MSLRDEIEVFDRVKVSPDTGETDTWDEIIFPNVIRKREIELILSQIEKVKPERILDFGCGAGWLSKILSSHGYYAVGIDSSSWLIKNAKELCSKKPLSSPSFIVGDGMNLPFYNDAFDLIVGVGILHHLKPDQGLAECYRVTSPGGTLLLMEPSKLNPIAALGRKIAPLDTHTPGEKPFTPRGLRKALLRKGWIIKDIKYLFPYSFGLARVLRKTKLDRQKFKTICPPIEASEKFIEQIPLLNRLCWIILVTAEKERASL